MDTVRHHQQHFHEVLRRGHLHHRLDVYDLHADIHSLHLPGDLAAGQKGAPGHRAGGHSVQLCGDLDQSDQRPARPVRRHLSGTVLMLVRAGVHPRDAVEDRVRVVRLRGSVHRLLHRSLRESGRLRETDCSLVSN